MIEKTFLDRVPTYPGRVILTPVSGNTYDMTRADSPTVEGTPIDKATFESIIQSRLTGRYYVPAYARNELSSITGLTVNPIPTSGWVVADGVATNGGFKATAKDGDADVVDVFDASTSTGLSVPNSTEHWVQIELPQAITVKKVQTYVYTIDTGVTITTLVQGSNDGASWATLATITGNQTGNTEVTLAKTGEYKFYRLYMTTPSTATQRFYTFAFTSYDVKTYAMAYTVPEGWPTVWTEGQAALIQIPAEAQTGAVVENTINGIPCLTVFQLNRRYELRYTGSNFVAKEV